MNSVRLSKDPLMRIESNESEAEENNSLLSPKGIDAVFSD